MLTTSSAAKETNVLTSPACVALKKACRYSKIESSGRTNSLIIGVRASKRFTPALKACQLRLFQLFPGFSLLDIHCQRNSQLNDVLHQVSDGFAEADLVFGHFEDQFVVDLKYHPRPEPARA